MKAAIYCRVSTDDKGQDPKLQIEKCRQYCKLNNHAVIAELIDEGISGDTFYYDRPYGKQLRPLMDKHKINGIVVFSIDRFSRQSPMKILPLIHNLNSRGVKFISVSEPVFNMESEFAEPMRYMLAWFSNYFLKQHKDKVNAGITKAKKYGTKSGRPIGRERKTDYKKIRLLHREGMSLSAISREIGCSKSSVKNALEASKRISF